MEEAIYFMIPIVILIRLCLHLPNKKYYQSKVIKIGFMYKLYIREIKSQFN